MVDRRNHYSVDGSFKSGVCKIFSGKFFFFFLLSLILDIERRVSRMLGKYFNTELHSQSYKTILSVLVAHSKPSIYIR